MPIDTVAAVRLAAFFGVFLLLAAAEAWAPRRELRVGRRRWSANLGILVLDTLIVRLVLLRLTAVTAALVAEGEGWGLFHQVPLPYWATVALSVLVLDFAIYMQHVMFHAVPLLWRLHMVHHADVDFDVTTGLRFHPIEIALSMLIKVAVVVLLGAPVLAVVIFEVLLNATSMFNHSNLAIPASADRVLRWLVVTPDMHRVHHSTIRNETNSNFGFNLPWWDRLCGTYTAQPYDGHTGMTIGLKQFHSATRQSLWWLIALPFRGRVGEYPVNRVE